MADIEKSVGFDGGSDEESPRRFDKEAQIRRGSITPQHDGFFQAFTLESFKRNPNARVVTEATDAEGRPLKDQPPAEPALAMKLKGRHLQMIAIGGSIGKTMASGCWHTYQSLLTSTHQALAFSLVQEPLSTLAVRHRLSSLTA